ncbi:MAG: GAF domain-containing sensor histidine kinase [Candidatus Wallbacteria bacterium]|nr:GAF domain-containing sensor histidine kinase [Candidatus Wallbacteria bacterium]
MTDIEHLPPGLEAVLPALLDVARELNSEKDLDRLLELTVPRVVCDLSGAERCTLFLLDRERGEIWSRVATGTEREIRLRLGEGIAGIAAGTGESLQTDDPYNDPRFARRLDEVTGFRTRGVLCVPLRDNSGQILGVFEVLNKREGSFTQRDRDVLELFGRQAAVAIDGARLHQTLLRTQSQLREQVRRFDILYRIEKEINRSEDFEEILSNVIRLCAEAMNTEAGSILLLEHSGARLYFQYACGEKSADLRRLWLNQNEGIAGWVIENHQVTMCNTPADDPRYSQRVSQELQYPVRNLMAAPLVGSGKTLGVLEAVNRRDRSFDSADKDLFEILASQVSGTIEKKILVEESRQAQRLAAVGGMAGRVIHDLKNSMSVIRGIAEMMDRKDVPPEKVQYRKQLILSAIDGLVAMTQDVLDYTRGDVVYEFEQVAVTTVTDMVFPLLERDCEIRKVMLTLDVPQELGVWADKVKLKRVFFNLAVNALDAMPSGGKLTITARLDDDALVRVDFTDNGPGISQSVIGKLFKPFVTHGKKYGTGLGLAICKSLVEAHRGHIGAENRPGGGATFSVWLPADETSAKAAEGN